MYNISNYFSLELGFGKREKRGGKGLRTRETATRRWLREVDSQTYGAHDGHGDDV